MAEDIAQPLKVRRLIGLLDNLIDQLNRFCENDAALVQTVDWECAEVIPRYLRDVGLEADAQQIKNEAGQLKTQATHISIWDFAQSNPESAESACRVFSLPPCESHTARVLFKKSCCHRAMHLRTLVNGMRQMLTQNKITEENKETTDDTRTQNKRGKKRAATDKITEACEVWIAYEREKLGRKGFCDWWNGNKKVGRVSPKWLDAKLSLVRKLIGEDRVPTKFKNKLRSLKRVNSVPKKAVKNSRRLR